MRAPGGANLMLVRGAAHLRGLAAENGVPHLTLAGLGGNYDNTLSDHPL